MTRLYTSSCALLRQDSRGPGANFLSSAIACSVVNIIKCHIHGGPGWSGLLTVVGSTSFLCLLGSELLFNLKEAAELGVNEGTNYRPRSVSTIDFDEAGQPREVRGPRSFVKVPYSDQFLSDDDDRLVTWRTGVLGLRGVHVGQESDARPCLPVSGF